MYELPPNGETVRTTCPYCGVGCGVLATRQANGSVDIKGDPDHPANFGRLCSKGSALGETLDFNDRLVCPEVDGKPVSWEIALDEIADSFRETIASHGPESVAIYGSGQLLTEDYYVANKFMKGFVGSANMDTNSRLCMASTVAGHKRAFGSDSVPGCYEDLELADLIVLVGSNLAWCHPVLFQRIAAARQSRPEMRIVLIDPRRTVTNEIADLHLAIDSDGDVALFGGLLRHLSENGAVNADFVSDNCDGFEDALTGVDQLEIQNVAQLTGLELRDVESFYRLFGSTERTVTVFSQGVNQSASGTDKVNAIINCHLATGRIGRPGMGPFSVTGQPNAMGGREVGGLANMLAAHMDFSDASDIDRVERFWNAPNIAQKPGLKAVDMFKAIGEGRIKLVWIISTNPVVSMPDADAAKEALKSCDKVIVSDISSASDTVQCADIKLPALGWGEKSGSVTNSERRISRQRPFMAGPQLARPDWWAIAQVAQRLGFGHAFDYRNPKDIFTEHAALSNFENDGARAFQLGALEHLDEHGYDALAPKQWPVSGTSATRLFGSGKFDTPNGRARFVKTPPPVLPPQVPHEFVLNTGRVRDHWHTMTRTGKTARLSAHMAEPFVEMHPDDALNLGIEPADLIELSNARGTAVGRALVKARQRRGHVFMPMHWTAQFASKGRVDVLTNDVVDPLSGQPALKMSRVLARKYPAEWYGFAFSQTAPVDLAAADYWALARTEGGYRVELAGLVTPHNWLETACNLFGCDAQAQSAIFEDRANGLFRMAYAPDGQVKFALFAARKPVSVARQWAVGNLKEQDAAQAPRLLAARPGADMPDQGTIICSCFSVGINTIVGAIVSGECASVEALGNHLKAGTNCGSCRSELKGLIDAYQLQAAE